MKRELVAKKQIIFGQPSWSVRSSTVEAFVTEAGGHLAPVIFDRTRRRIQPYSVSPWWNEKLSADTPTILKVLRGDFFCLPFGGNTDAFRGEHHPVHGETANRKWKFENLSCAKGRTTLHLSLKISIRPGRVDKHISLLDGQNAVYCQDIVSGMRGPVNFGHHAMLKFPDQPGSGVLSHSPIQFGMVTPQAAEDPATFGYSILKPGAKFSRLNRVPTMTGGWADLSQYPARRGFEDIALLATKPIRPFAWIAVTFPAERYVWFALKDPKVLRQTLLWHSNGGRHYAPWNGQHLNVLGIEDLTSYFHYGVAPSARRNQLNKLGLQTCLTLRPQESLMVNYIMGVAVVPRSFNETRRIEPERNGIRLISGSGRSVTVPLRFDFVNTGEI
jgi:hypothetical protein